MKITKEREMSEEKYILEQKCLQISRLSDKGKVPGAAVSKDHTDSFWDMKGLSTINFLKKGAALAVLPIANAYGKIHLSF